MRCTTSPPMRCTSKQNTCVGVADSWIIVTWPFRPSSTPSMSSTSGVRERSACSAPSTWRASSMSDIVVRDAFDCMHTGAGPRLDVYIARARSVSPAQRAA